MDLALPAEDLSWLEKTLTRHLGKRKERVYVEPEIEEPDIEEEDEEY